MGLLEKQTEIEVVICSQNLFSVRYIQADPMSNDGNDIFNWESFR